MGLLNMEDDRLQGLLSAKPNSIAGLLGQVGTYPGENLTSMAKQYVAELPAKTAQNAINTNDMVHKSMPYSFDPRKPMFDPNPDYDPKAAEEFNNNMANFMGGINSVNIAKGLLPVEAQSLGGAMSKSDEIKNAAEEFAKKIQELGFSADVNHSGSKAGASSYVTVFDPTTGRYVRDPFRFSGHSKGAFQSQFVNEISDLEKQFPDIQNTLMAMRKQGLAPALQLNKIQQLEVDELVNKGMKPRSAWKQVLNKKLDDTE